VVLRVDFPPRVEPNGRPIDAGVVVVPFNVIVARAWKPESYI
jgi:hypothetical protein